MSDNCKHELRLANLEKESAVNMERNKGLGKHVEDIADSVKLMQRYIIGFIISITILLSGSIVNEHITGGKAMADTYKVNQTQTSVKGIKELLK